MTTACNWHRSAKGSRWIFKKAGADCWVSCDEYGWIRVDEMMPELFTRVQVWGQHRFASMAAPHRPDYDSRRNDDAGEHWGSHRNVTHWQPETHTPSLARAVQ